eukprot:6888986-Prymnesium_polylepis.1
MVNWEVGQTMLITGTTLKDARDFHQNELRTIVAVATDGLSVTLNAPLTYVHIATAAYQAEVALLVTGAATRTQLLSRPPQRPETQPLSRPPATRNPAAPWSATV